MKTTSSNKPKVTTPEQWLASRLELLREEKEFTRLRDRIAQRRRELPWVKIEKPYRFDSPRGKVTLADLFEGRSQLIVQHFMFGPGWEEGCKSCSFMMDHFNPAVPHLKARDVSFAAISHAPLAEILPFKARMGWTVNWVSAHDTDFNRDFHVSFTEKEMAAGLVDYNYTKMQFPHKEAPGISVFARDAAGTVHHTYSTYGRGVDVVMGTYNLLDLVPKGRDEDGLEYGMEWVRYHDRYDHATAAR
ncbi:MAG TPA: thioredoxin family protein [Lacunisphaera sp.]|nr:thioredoxin family protein [Lacunisphaera sp.]